MFHSLLLAEDVHFPLVVVEIDALMVHQALRDVNSIRSHWSILLLDVLWSLKYFHEVIVSHVSRGCNKLAHKLAKFSLRSSIDHIWLEETLSFILFDVP